MEHVLYLGGPCTPIWTWAKQGLPPRAEHHVHYFCFLPQICPFEIYFSHACMFDIQL